MGGKRRQGPRRSKRGRSGKGRRRGGERSRSGDVIFGYYSKEEAERLFRLLERAEVPGVLGFDRELSRQHRKAASINPVIRRARSFRDVKMGYYVSVDRAHRDRALAAVEGTGFRLAGDVRAEGAQEGGGLDGRPDFDADPRYCPACDAEVPPRRRRCPTCGGETVDILRRGKTSGSPRLPWWVLVLLGVLVATVVALRLLR